MNRHPHTSDASLLFAHDDDGTPYEASPEVPAASVDVKPPEYLSDPSADANVLEKQKWALLVPDTDSQGRYESLAGELVAQREADQDCRVNVIRVPTGMSAVEAHNWREENYPQQYGGGEGNRPRYLLLMGDIDEISLATQLVLGIDSFPGRLACETDDGYSAYVDKVLRWQRKPSPKSAARSLFYTVDDGTQATGHGYDKLITPLHSECAKVWQTRRAAYPAESVHSHGWGDEPDPDDFLDVAGKDTPSVLFSLSHGKGPPRRSRSWTRERARLLQGSMQFGRAGAVTREEVGHGNFLPGGFWFYFACFGAGTPSESAFARWLALRGDDNPKLRQVLAGLAKDGGFTSGVTKAALANPNGPLAIYGHFDLAWSFSFESPRGTRSHPISRAKSFFTPLAKLLQKERAGAAFLALQLELGRVNAEINTTYAAAQLNAGTVHGAPETTALSNLWMLREDLGHYVLLGDPAVRLPLSKPRKRTHDELMSSIFGGFVTNPTSSTSRQAPEPVGEQAARTMELAVLTLLKDGSQLDSVSKKFAVSPTKLRAWAQIYRDAGRKALAETPSEDD